MRYVHGASAQRGFTLLEIMVVVTILGLLAAFIVPNVIGQGDKAKVDLARSNMSGIASALDFYKLDNKKYPSTEQGLEALVTKPDGASNWNPNGYLPKLPKDPWDNPYVYISPGIDGKPYDLYSLGADGVDGGEDFNADLSFRD